MPLDRGVSFTYLGHSTILIETRNCVRLLIDPWLASNPACPEDWRDVSRLGHLDAMLVTHIHGDHVGDAELVLRAQPDLPVIAIFEACLWAQTKGAQRILPMNKGGKIQFGQIEIAMTHAIHSSSFEEADGSLFYGGEAAGYVLKFEDGFTIYHSGDTCLFGDMALIRDLYSPSLAILPIGDNFTMGPKQAAIATKMLGVTHVIPVHHSTFGLLTGTPEAFRSEANGISGLQIHALAPGETLS